MAVFHNLTFTIWLLKRWRALGPGLIRSRGAKSNQSKRERRAEPSLNKRVCHLLCVISVSTGVSLENRAGHQSRTTSLFLYSPTLLMHFPQCLKKTWVTHSPYCLTLTSQYDMHTICLSSLDITTALLAAGPQGLLHYHGLQTHQSLIQPRHLCSVYNYYTA